MKVIQMNQQLDLIMQMTPAYTRFITQVFEKYDISKGEFISQLRPLSWRSAIKKFCGYMTPK